MIEQKKSRGRPRKDGSPAQPRKVTVTPAIEKNLKELVAAISKESLEGDEPIRNPDCEPATKGFVKCLLRKYSIHQHEPEGNTYYAKTGAAYGWVITMALFFMWAMPNSVSVEAVITSWVIPMLLFSIACTIIYYEADHLCTHKTTFAEGVPNEIRKWQPPACEKKDDCQ